MSTCDAPPDRSRRVRNANCRSQIRQGIANNTKGTAFVVYVLAQAEVRRLADVFDT